MAKSKYTEKLFEDICNEIANSSLGLKYVCEKFDVSSRAFYKWLREDQDKGEEDRSGLVQRYTRAREEQAHMIANEIIQIADDGAKDTIEIHDQNGNVKEVEDKEWTSRSKLRVEARKWVASKLLPQKYGDKLDLTSKGNELKATPIIGMQIINTEPDKDGEE